MQRFRLIIFLLLTSLLMGCGVKFFYRNLDFFIPWYVDDFVELNNLQEDYLDKVISKHQSWHRKEQLPEYINLLENLANTVEKQHQKIDESYVKNLSEKIRSYYQSISDKVLPDIITLLIGILLGGMATFSACAIFGPAGNDQPNRLRKGRSNSTGGSYKLKLN